MYELKEGARARPTQGVVVELRTSEGNSVNELMLILSKIQPSCVREFEAESCRERGAASS